MKSINNSQICLKHLIKNALYQGLLIACRMFIELCYSEGFHFSDLLKALAEYADSESRKIAEEYLTWQEVKSHLLSASDIAETPGKELP